MVRDEQFTVEADVHGNRRRDIHNEYMAALLWEYALTAAGPGRLRLKVETEFGNTLIRRQKVAGGSTISGELDLTNQLDRPTQVKFIFSRSIFRRSVSGMLQLTPDIGGS